MTTPSPQTKKAKPALKRASAWPFLWSLIYLALLIVPWVLTCLLNKGKFHYQDWNKKYVYHNITFGAQPRDITYNTRLAHATDILSYIAAVASLPLIFALLARAAAVYSQRTSLTKPLSAKQLFSLADGKLIRRLDSSSRGSWLYYFGTCLIILSVIQLPIRAISVQRETIHIAQGSEPTGREGWQLPKYENPGFNLPTPDYLSGQLMGFDPTPDMLRVAPRDMVVARARSAMKSLVAEEVLVSAWRDARDDPNYYTARPFASSVSKHIKTGLYRQLATRMNSTCHCEEAEFPSQCDDGGLNYKSENLTIEFCVDGLFKQNPWKLEQYQREDVTEEFYVRVSADQTKLYYALNQSYRCTGTSSLGYFELGNHFNNGEHGPLISAPYRTPETADQAGFHVFYGNLLNPYSSPHIVDRYPPVPGPLALALLALFGPGSFSHVAQSIKSAEDEVSRTLCKTLPFHFADLEDDLVDNYLDEEDKDGDIHPSACLEYQFKRDPETDRPVDGIDWHMKSKWQDTYLLKLVSSFLSGTSRGYMYAPPRDFGGQDGNPWLSMAMHFANQALLDVASKNTFVLDNPKYQALHPTAIWNIPGLEYNKPSISLAGVIVVSVFLGLQVLGILFLLGYIYSTPTWTAHLDALAVARIAHQLPDDDQALLKEIGLRRVRSFEKKKLGVAAAGSEENAEAAGGAGGNAEVAPPKYESRAPLVLESAV
ncbi:hypothetical protein B0T20DRAFT_484059 [Sordaria brevicollis]|uniref:Uncharacterized protein n=1 Tax=Sordaria brevicollis TaxID=83679 RepID=A0AAE0NW12_SORBR|nr:hypothetical protein B0T20DRAFT_484059 [Sordaria brevicollis]